MNPVDTSSTTRAYQKNQPVAVDVFCGVGGLTCGMRAAGLPVVAGIDFDESCQYAFEHNNEARFLHRDVTTIKSQEVADLYPADSMRILVGCAPCQPFSQVPGEREDKEGKWRLLYSFADLIEKVNPAVVSMENVTQLAGHKEGVILKDFIKKLEALGYEVTKYRVNAAHYGVPQRRYRLILFASKFGKVELIEQTHDDKTALTVASAIQQLPEIKGGTAHSDDSLHIARKLNPINERRIKATPEGGDWTAWPSELLEGLDCRKTKEGKKFTSAYGRMSWQEPAPTLTTFCTGLSNGRYGHPKQDRAISLREAALIQSFPASYSFVKKDETPRIGILARHIGNAVPPKLGEAIALSILKHLTKTSAHGRQAKMAL
jgi:DNA (cytosine-5)-methyltransferase 1